MYVYIYSTYCMCMCVCVYPSSLPPTPNAYIIVGSTGTPPPRIGLSICLALEVPGSVPQLCE